MGTPWTNAVFYHLYPLGAFGAPKLNDGFSVPEHRLERLPDWIPRMRGIGADYLYLGPIFESESHGYDTVDYLTVDRRLGTNADFATVTSKLADEGIGLVLDAVFNHVGRRHPIVRDVVDRGASSKYASWIAGYDPRVTGRGGLPFGYEGWKGHYDLVKLDTGRQEVREYLIGTALCWMEEFGIAGLRLDAADCLDRDFIRQLASRCKAVDPDFFLLGEAVHGDAYAPLTADGMLDSVTNYEAWKGLWSSYNDQNYFEIAWTLDRLSGDGGLVEGKMPYNFADNHDVDRLASLIRDQAGLYPTYGLLFSMPGIPSIYYGSEFAVSGRKSPGDDGPLRPFVLPSELPSASNRDLADAIGRFSRARKGAAPLRKGNYRTLAVENEGLAFLRSYENECVVVAVNGCGSPKRFSFEESLPGGRVFRDLLDPEYSVRTDSEGRVSIEVPPHWTRWLSC